MADNKIKKNMDKKEKRFAVSVSLTESERDKLREIAKSYGLSVSAFLRLAASKYIEQDNEVK